VEFALTVLPFLLVIFGALQMFIIFYLQGALQTATQKSARLILTGNAPSTAAAYKTDVCSNLPALFDCNRVFVDVQESSQFNTLNLNPINITYTNTGAPVASTAYNVGAAQSAVILRVYYNYPVLGRQFGFGTQANGTFLLQGTAVFQNEPYNGNSAL
jgi:Flp pilus assembly protein TadG